MSRSSTINFPQSWQMHDRIFCRIDRNPQWYTGATRLMCPKCPESAPNPALSVPCFARQYRHYRASRGKNGTEEEKGVSPGHVTSVPWQVWQR
eukprot:2709818-Rhodomonas_salina.1